MDVVRWGKSILGRRNNKYKTTKGRRNHLLGELKPCLQCDRRFKPGKVVTDEIEGLEYCGKKNLHLGKI